MTDRMLVENLSEQYLQVTDTLYALDITSVDGFPIPEFDSVVNSITEDEEAWLADRQQLDTHDKLVIAPYIGTLSLDAFLRKTRHHIDTTKVSDRLTRNDNKHNRRMGAVGWSMGMLLNDTHDKRGHELEFPGLLFTGKSFERQKVLARLERLHIATRGLNIKPVTIPEQVIGKLTYPESNGGTTRLIHLPAPSIFLPRHGKGPGPLGLLIPSGHPGAPEITGNRITIDTSALHKKDKHAGVRRVLLLGDNPR